jgi:hypothetical protein
MCEDDENWSTFRDRYLATSAELLNESPRCQRLPQVFIGRVIEEQMSRFAKRDASSGGPEMDNAEPPRQDCDWVVIPREDFLQEKEEAANTSI